MTEHVFSDKQQPTNGLPHWATITQVSTFFHVPRTTVRDMARRASAAGKPWVKQERDEDGKSRYLIDTTHEAYKAYEQQWAHKQAQREEQEAGMTISPADWYNSDGCNRRDGYRPSQPRPSHTSHTAHIRSEDTALSLNTPNTTTPSTPSHTQRSWSQHRSFDDVLRLWPLFRQRLYSWGLQIFQNILAEEGQKNPWQWRWGELHGEGYRNEEEAIIAALESQFIPDEQAYVDQSPDDTFHFTLSTEQALSHQIWSRRFINLFRRRNHSSPF